jgi:hypothetical protein
MPMEMAGLAGTIGGIAELTRTALDATAQQTAQRRGSVPPARTGQQT